MIICIYLPSHTSQREIILHIIGFSSNNRKWKSYHISLSKTDYSYTRFDYKLAKAIILLSRRS